MTKVVKSNTPWLAALWLCCGTAAVVAQEESGQEEQKAGPDVQAIIRDAIQNAQESGESNVSVEVKSIQVQDGGEDAKSKVTGRVIVTDGNGKTKTINLDELMKKGGHRVLELDGDVFEVMKMDDLDLNFDALKNNSAIRLRSMVDGEAVPKFRIGVSCEPVDAAIRAHVKMPADALMVRDVVEDGPASKAGMKQYDILVRVADKPVGSLETLVEQIQASKGEEVDVVVLRKGEETTVSIKPEKRKASEVRQMLIKSLSDGLGDGQHNLNIVVNGEDMGDVFQFEALRPGILLDKSADVEKLMKRLPMIIGRDIENVQGRGRREIRINRKSKSERSAKADETESHDAHHDGDKDEAAQQDDEDEDSDESDKLQSRVTELSKEIKRLEASLKKLQSKRR